MGRIFDPFTIGHHFRILPETHPPIDDNRINIRMAAGAFGSGEHETTASCLELLEHIDQVRGAHILDLGSGTGILSIAALQLGAQSAHCVDIDPAAVATCRYNAELNNLSDRITHTCGTLDQVEEESFDLILANIYGDILLAVADTLIGKAAIGAPLLLSGILYEYNFDIRQRYRNLGCSITNNRMLGEFSTILLQKDASHGKNQTG